MSIINALETERDVLRKLLLARRAAFMVWDQDLNPVWISEAMQTWIGQGVTEHELNRAAAAAFSRLQSRGAPAQLSSEVSVLQPSSGADETIVAKFSSIPMEDGHRWLAVELTRARGTHAKLGTVTRAEADVLRLLARGLSNREIGLRLYVSKETVRTHVRRILNKLEVSSRTKAASLVREAWSEFEQLDSD